MAPALEDLVWLVREHFDSCTPEDRVQFVSDVMEDYCPECGWPAPCYCAPCYDE